VDGILAARMINFALGEWVMLGSRRPPPASTSSGSGWPPPSASRAPGTASYLVLIAVLFARPHGLFGRPVVERV
jgi:branched-subunit amino acid ABC-type transport system permease component